MTQKNFLEWLEGNSNMQEDSGRWSLQLGDQGA